MSCNKPVPDVVFQRGRVGFELGAKVLVSSSKILYFPQLKLQNKSNFSTITYILRHFTCIPLATRKNRGIGLIIENFNSEILSFKAFFLNIFTCKVTIISDKIEAAG